MNILCQTCGARLDGQVGYCSQECFDYAMKKKNSNKPDGILVSLHGDGPDKLAEKEEIRVKVTGACGSIMYVGRIEWEEEIPGKKYPKKHNRTVILDEQYFKLPHDNRIFYFNGEMLYVKALAGRRKIFIGIVTENWREALRNTLTEYRAGLKEAIPLEYDFPNYQQTEKRVPPSSLFAAYTMKSALHFCTQFSLEDKALKHFNFKTVVTRHENTFYVLLDHELKKGNLHFAPVIQIDQEEYLKASEPEREELFRIISKEYNEKYKADVEALRKKLYEVF